MEPVTVTVSLTFWERYRISAFLWLRAFRFLLWLAVPFVLFFLMLLGYVVFFPSPDHTFSQLMESSGPAPYVFLGGAALLIGSPLVFVWRSYSGPGGREASRYVISEAGVEIDNSLATANIKWEAFVRSMETRNFFLVFVASGLAHPWPKRVLGDDETVRSVRELLRRKIKKSKLKT